MADKVEKETSVAGRAWNATKVDGDPDWGSIPNLEFKGKLEFAAEKVKETGIAQTNFEVEVKKILAEEATEAKDEGPMAVVDPERALGGPAVTAETAKEVGPSKSSKSPEGKAAAEAKADSKAAAEKTDKSGQVAKAAPAPKKAPAKK